MLRNIVLVVTLAARFARSVPVKNECLSKLPQLAGPSGTSGVTVFDWTEEIVEEFNSQSKVLLKRSCLNSSGDLNSFRLVLLGYETGSNLLTDSAGPSELGTCSNKQAPSQEHPNAAKIYYDTNRVQGVEFTYSGTQEILLIGRVASSSTSYTFSETSSFIGFFGTQTSTNIRQLGFIVLDITCTEQAVSGGTGNKVFDASIKYEETSNTNMFIIIAIASAMLIIFILIWYCICSRKKPVQPP